MTWAPFLVSNFSRIASVRAALDRRRFLTVNPGRALFCDLLPSPGTGARPERVGQATNKSFCVRSKTRRANVARQQSQAIVDGCACAGTSVARSRLPDAIDQRPLGGTSLERSPEKQSGRQCGIANPARHLM